MALIVDGDIADKLVCSECGRYLSVGPVKITKDRGTLCGRCSAGRPGAPSMLNVLARSALFPCVNRFEGCSELLASSEITEHEEKCTSHEFACEIPDCTFVGPSLQLLKHFKSSHRERVIDFPEVIFQVFKDFQNIYVYFKENQMFYVTVAYDETTKTVSVSVKSAVDGSPAAAGIRLRDIAGETLHENGMTKDATPITVEISKMFFVKAVVVLSFSVDTHTACLYPGSVVAKMASAGREPPSFGAECEIFNAVELGRHGTFCFRLSNFSELSGDYVVASHSLLGLMWSVVVETTCTGDEARKFLSVTVCCTPRENKLPDQLDLILALTSNISADMEIKQTRMFPVDDGSVHCVFENFAEYSDILDGDRGLVSGGSLMFKVGFRKYYVKALEQPPIPSTACSSSVISESAGHCCFEVKLTRLKYLSLHHSVESNNCKVFEGNCHVSVKPTYLGENLRNSLLLAVSYDHQSNSKITFDIDVMLKSSLSDKIQIKETKTCVINSKVQVTTIFENFVEYQDIFDLKKGFITVDGTLVFHVNLKKANVINPATSAQPERSLWETTVINHTFKTVPSRSQQVKARDLLWHITTAAWVVNGKRHLSVYLHCSPERHDVIWACKANVTFILVGKQNNVLNSFENIFHEGESNRGFRSFAIMETISNRQKGYFQNGVCTIRVLLMTDAPKIRPKKSRMRSFSPAISDMQEKKARLCSVYVQT